jgi:hypothetical protein
MVQQAGEGERGRRQGPRQLLAVQALGLQEQGLALVGEEAGQLGGLGRDLRRVGAHAADPRTRR